MFSTPSIGQPVQFFARAESDPQAAIITDITDPGPNGAVTVKVFPAPGDFEPMVDDTMDIPYLDSSATVPVFPCWRHLEK